ncbi:hypothetical protein [Streptomyces hokutonensis]|uniref:hypothetical protein n=1 Tax=Streptomyces hokutonensis TaxID=1306990 RepID=UPI0036BA5D39
MGCGCGSNSKRSVGAQSAARPSRTTYQVVLDDGNGRVAFTTNNKPLADKVSGNYPGSIVRPLGASDSAAVS